MNMLKLLAVSVNRQAVRICTNAESQSNGTARI